MEGDKRFSVRVAEGADPGPAIVAASRAAEEFAAACGLGDARSARLLVCIQELVSNALRHGGAARVDLELYARPGGIEIVVCDNGAAFDPSGRGHFGGPDEQTGGGVGLELVRRWAQEMAYARENDSNVVRLLLAPE